MTQLVVIRNPFDCRERDTFAIDGQRPVAALVGEYIPAGATEGVELVAVINGAVVPREEWETRCLSPGEQLIVLPVVGKGGGGLLGSLASLALMVVAPAIGGAIAGSLGLGTIATIGSYTLTWGTVIGMGVSLLGSAVIGSMTAPDVPTLPNAGLQSYDNSPSYGWNPATTQEPGGVIVRAFGTVKLYGNIIGGYIQDTGDTGRQQTANVLIDLGMGPYSALRDFKLNGQPIENFTNVTLEYRLGQLDQAIIPAFDDTRITRTIGAKVVNGAPVTRTTAGNDFDALEVKLLFPNGLYYANDQGGLSTVSVSLTVEYSDDGGATWTPAESVTVSGAQQQPIRRTVRIDNLTRGQQYDVRVTNLSADQTSNRYGDDLYFSELNEILYDDFTYPRTVLVGIKALATDQLSGSISFECIGDCAIIRVWNGSAWANEVNSNPAWVAWDVLTQPVYDNALNIVRYDGMDPARLILDEFYAWAQWCDELVPDGNGGTEPRCRFDAIYDTPRTMWESALEVAASARATLVLRGTRVGVVYDHARTTPAQLFNVGNTRVNSFEETFLPMQDRASAIEVEFIDGDNGHQRDKITIVNAGVTEAAAQRVQFANRGIRRASQAWREGMYRAKRNELLKRTATLGADIDAIACTVGDLVWVQNDITRWGEGGRAEGGSTTTRLYLDKPVTLASGKSYELKLRLDDDTLLSRNITTAAGTVTYVDVDTPFPSAPEIYAPWAIGEVGRAVKEFVVADIVRDGEQRATLQLVEYNASLNNVDLLLPTVPTPNISPSSVPSVSGLVLREGMDLAVDGTVNVFVDVYFDLSSARSGRVMLNDQVQGDALTGHWRINGVTSGTSLSVAVAPVDYFGRVGAIDGWATGTIDVVGKLANPADITSFTIDGDTLRWTPVADIDLDGYLIRWQPGSNRSWGDAQPLHDGLIVSSPYTMLNRPSGPVTLMIKAVDTSSNESANAAAIITELGDPLVANVVATTDYHADGFTGAITNGSVDGGTGDLLADADPSPLMWRSNSAANMWADDSTSLMWVGTTYKALVYQDGFTIDAADAAAQVTIARDIDGTYVIEWRPDGANAMWGDSAAPMWGADDTALMWTQAPWSPWPGTAVAVPGSYEIRASVADGAVQGRMAALAVNIDVPDLMETLADIAIASGGTRLALTNSYRAIRAVNLTLQTGAGAALTAKAIDKNASLGPLIQCFDSSNAATTGTVDAIIQGY